MEWISVEERLPEERQYVIVCYLYDQPFGGPKDQRAVFAAWLVDGQWVDDDEKYIFSRVTHWMPLPPPPMESLPQQEREGGSDGVAIPLNDQQEQRDEDSGPQAQAVDVLAAGRDEGTPRDGSPCEASQPAQGTPLYPSLSREHSDLMLLAAADLESWMKSFNGDTATEDLVKRLRDAAHGVTLPDGAKNG